MAQKHYAKHTLAVLIVLFASIGRANAQFSIVWDNSGSFAFPASQVPAANPPDGAIASGEVHNLTGTLTNTSGQTLFVNTASWYPLLQANGQLLAFQNDTYSSGTYQTDEESTFLFNPAGIAPGASYIGTLSFIVIDDSTAPGFYDRDNSGNLLTDDAGIITIDSFTDSAFTQSLGTYRSPNINVTIGASADVPEPSSLLLSLPLLGLFTVRSAVLRKRRRK